MITNLLDKTVKGTSQNGEEVVGKVCAVFSENNNGFCMAVIGDNGKIYTCYSNSMSVYDSPIYSVTVRWDDANKIKVIKLLRTINDIGLKEAKDLVEATNGKITIKTNLTLDAARKLQENILSEDNLVAEISKGEISNET